MINCCMGTCPLDGKSDSSSFHRPGYIREKQFSIGSRVGARGRKKAHVTVTGVIVFSQEYILKGVVNAALGQEMGSVSMKSW